MAAPAVAACSPGRGSRSFSSRRSFGTVPPAVVSRTGLPIFRDDFEVFVYHLLPGIDPLAQRLAARADHFRHCPGWRPAQIAPRIRADALDVLVYQGVRHRRCSVGLAALRLRPIAMRGWGHPVPAATRRSTSFSPVPSWSRPMARAHYTEQLVMPLESARGIGCPRCLRTQRAIASDFRRAVHCCSVRSRCSRPVRTTTPCCAHVARTAGGAARVFQGT